MTMLINTLRNEVTSIADERRLEPQAVERLPDLQCSEAIVCTGGILWITQEGDPEDYMLRKGSAFVVNRQVVVVVQALTKATYRISKDYKMYEWRKR